MPADETYDVVHEKVKKTGIHPPCWNNRKEFKDGYFCEERHYQPDGRWSRIMQWIPHKMTRECQQPGKGFQPDPTCVGCNELKR